MTTDDPFENDHDPAKGMPEIEIIRPAVFHPFVSTRTIRDMLDALEFIENEDDLLHEVSALIQLMPPLLSELERMYDLMRAERIRYANLRAACLAAFSADQDGETDALSYIRDEFGSNPAHDGRHWGRR
jgi:hypothetical protein